MANLVEPRSGGLPVPVALSSVLFMHGTEDATVNHENSVKMFEQASEPKELWLCQGAGHCQTLNADRAEFARRVGALVQKVKAAPVVPLSK